MAALALIILAVESGTAVSLVPSGFAFLPLDKPIILSGVIGGVVGLGFFLLVMVIYQLIFHHEGLGMGDVKLACLIGLVTGWPMFIEALFIGILLGGLVAIVLLLLRLKGRKAAVPYGTFLAIGPLVTLFWGVNIFHWYQNLFGFHIIP
jgi:prepilin signal peptidase PulO-like enzyme (type II secretory pathway)